MIAHARITSATEATIQFAERSERIVGETRNAVRTSIKNAFIEESRRQDRAIDVVIFDGPATHNLRVEPNGRIQARDKDDRPLYRATAAMPESTRVRQATRRGARSAASAASAASAVSAASAASASPAASAVSAASAPSAASAASASSASPAPRGTHARELPQESGSPAEAASASSPSLKERLAEADARTGADSMHTPEALQREDGQDPLEVTSEQRDEILNDSEGAPHAGDRSAGPEGPAPAERAEAAASTDDAAQPDSSQSASTSVHEPRVSAKRELPKDDRPTLDDLRAGNAAQHKQLATRGFNKFMRRASLGMIRLGPGRAEREDMDRVSRIRKQLEAPKNIAVVNLKGGAHKTTSVLMLAATLGMYRGGSVLAWDNNETRGTLGWRGIPSDHHLTALDLLNNLDHFVAGDARVADLDRYVRPQGDMNFDILASDEDPGSAASINGDAFYRLNDTLSRFYRIKVVDTGNNVRASNWLAAVESADQLVIVSTVREDTFNAAAWMIDELRMTGHTEQVENAVTILSHSSRAKIDRVLHKRLLHHFGAHTRAVLEVPFEEHFVDGGSLDWSKLSKATREAWLEATATVADGL